jgi:flagellar basal body-associated protein FliL
MAEKDKKEQAQTSKKKLPLKTIGVLAAVLLIEAGAISAVFLLAGGPADVKGDSAAVDKAAIANRPVEQLVVEEKFQNTRTGRTYLYETEVYIVVRQKYQKDIEKELESKRAQITTDIATIFRRADPVHLLEPTLATITRQIQAVLDQRLEPDEDTGESRVMEVLVRKCIQYKADL